MKHSFGIYFFRLGLIWGFEEEGWLMASRSFVPNSNFRAMNNTHILANEWLGKEHMAICVCSDRQEVFYLTVPRNEVKSCAHIIEE